jgi:predicted TIM-barrel fold metal-dependent hydrolase
MVQVMLPLLDWRWAKPHYAPVFAAIERRGLRAAMHPVGGVTEPAMGDPPTLGEWFATIQQNHMSQLTSLIFYGVLDRYPGLRVAFLESGIDWLPSMLSRLDYNYQSFRAEVPWVRRLPSEYVLDRCVFTTHPFAVPDDGQLEALLELLPDDRPVVFASNYPRFDFDPPDETLPLDSPARERLMLRNALRFYDR